MSVSRLTVNAWGSPPPAPRERPVGDVGIGRGGAARMLPAHGRQRPASMSSVVRALCRPTPRSFQVDLDYYENLRGRR